MEKEPEKTAMDVARSLISQRAEKLHELEQAIRNANYAYEREVQQLGFVLKHHPELLEEQAKYAIENVLDNEERFNSLKDFRLQGDKVPFFSEGKLYDLVGKEDARSILSRIAELHRRARR